MNPYRIPAISKHIIESKQYFILRRLTCWWKGHEFDWSNAIFVAGWDQFYCKHCNSRGMMFRDLVIWLRSQ